MNSGKKLMKANDYGFVEVIQNTSSMILVKEKDTDIQIQED